MPRKESIVNASSAQAQQDSASQGIDEFELPKSVVTKLARAALPENTKMQKDMLLAVLKGSTVFVNYLAANAHEVANSRQHKSVSASDVLRALEQMDMGDIVPKLQAELEVYRSKQKADKGKKSGSRAKGKDAQSAPSDNAKTKIREKGAGPTITIPGRSTASASAPPLAKKLRQGLTPEPGPEPETEDPPRRAKDEEDEEMLDEDQYDSEEDVEDEADEDDGVDENEGDELEDRMAIEEEELRRDARGVEEREREDEVD